MLGTTYGGNGQTNFALADLRGRVPLGAGQGPGLPNYALGEQVASVAPSLTPDNLPAHAHLLPSGWSSGMTGNGVPIENRQPGLALNFMIAADGEIMIVARLSECRLEDAQWRAARRRRSCRSR